MKEFHIKRYYRNKYKIKDRMAFFNSRVIFVSLSATRELASAINKNKKKSQRAILEQDLFAMALIEEINHFLISEYSKAYKKGSLFLDIIECLDIDKESLYHSLYQYIDEFPTYEVYNNLISIGDYLLDKKEILGMTVCLEEMLLLDSQNKNPAFSKVGKKLFDDSKLKHCTSYDFIIKNMHDFFQKPDMKILQGEDIISIIFEPIKKYPNSIQEQLKFLLEKWKHLLSTELILKAETSIEYLDELAEYFLREKDRKRKSSNLDFYKGVEDYTNYLNKNEALSRNEYEAFTSDYEWMPSSIMLAKFTLVWLVQLSKKYNKEIDTLDKIPSDELTLIRDRGFTVLWLIGIWQRSDASRRIKQLKGNPNAEASAYSLMNYEIYDKLGGWSSFLEFKRRCQKFGIRLAGDMVPNHTAIDSDWVINNPNRFVQLKNPPSPNYTFNRDPVSTRNDVSIYLEDHYYTEEDASVVFKRVDHKNNDTRYIYHGNDGTSMPWNDTAQINLLDKDTYETLINEIINVSKNFSVIRLDAAMTFVNQHYKRLWYPSNDDRAVGPPVYSRIEHGMSKEDYQKAMPHEFWRDLIDRLNQENPNTLLIAEAFWQLEGYFVRTLGMHRVYMSAFMKMLHKKKNTEYRNLIKETLVYDKQILKRYVNFMSNPDEDTAISQFGDGDFYFGVATMLSTLPGLPMFAHGQVEGLREKYGMEYMRPHDQGDIENFNLVKRHENEIFPLLKMRELFSDVENFYLFDFIEGDHINENVFVYSNKNKDVTSLFVFNNGDPEVEGKIFRSNEYVDYHDGPKKTKTIAEVLGLHNDDNHFVVMPNFLSKNYRLVPSREIFEYGLNFDFNFKISPYGRYIYLNIKEVKDTDGIYKKIYDQFNSKGEIENIEKKHRHGRFGHIYNLFQNFKSDKIISLIKNILESNSIKESEKSKLKQQYLQNLSSIKATEETFDKSYNMLRNLSIFSNYHKKTLENQIALINVNPINSDTLISFGVFCFVYPLAKKEWKIYSEISENFSINLNYFQKLEDFDFFKIELKDKLIINHISKKELSCLTGLNIFDEKQYVDSQKINKLFEYMKVFYCINSATLNETSIKRIEKKISDIFKIIEKSGFCLDKIKIVEKKAKKTTVLKDVKDSDKLKRTRSSTKPKDEKPKRIRKKKEDKE